jgi:predicted nucleic acid-binding protein
MIVVDTNIIAYLLLPGTHTNNARSAYLKDPRWTAPLLWRSEFRNVLAMYLKKELFSFGESILLAQKAEDMMRGNEYQVASRQVLDLVSSSKCTAYDCEFVALADHLGVPLVTSDAALVKSFPRIAVPLGKFVS